MKTRMSFKNANNVSSKPSTVARAALTAEIKLTRGKQLVEQNPFNLIPDPFNPRPNEIINDDWLAKHLHLNTPQSKCYLSDDGEYVIPDFSELGLNDKDENLYESYEFLRNLAYSLRQVGLIEPIEIFLADKNNDPEYFNNSDVEFGYVILEGHQRRLAAMIGGLATITCIEITDETLLRKLKVKNRKIRRQLAENNLRKNLTTYQNYIMVKNLIASDEQQGLNVKELSSIIGLNRFSTAPLLKLATEENLFPVELFNAMKDNKITLKWLRTWINKPADKILEAINKLEPSEEKPIEITSQNPRNAGAKKKYAIFKIKDEKESSKLISLLCNRFPEISFEGHPNTPHKSLESVLQSLLNIAKSAQM